MIYRPMSLSVTFTGPWSRIQGYVITRG